MLAFDYDIFILAAVIFAKCCQHSRADAAVTIFGGYSEIIQKYAFTVFTDYLQSIGDKCAVFKKSDWFVIALTIKLFHNVKRLELAFGEIAVAIGSV